MPGEEQCAASEKLREPGAPLSSRDSSGTRHERHATETKHGAERALTILHTNDEHSALLPYGAALGGHQNNGGRSVGGFARLATAIGRVRTEKEGEGEPVLTLSAGDFLGGTAFSWLTLRNLAPELALMHAMEYDAVTIGNHEYDFGSGTLAHYLVNAGYPEAHDTTLLLATNTAPAQDHPLAATGMLRHTGILRLGNGLSVGVFGLIGDEAIAVMHSNSDVAFLERCQSARNAVDRLRAQGADIIVVLSHSGVKDDTELVRTVPGIDVIVSGHCHSVLHEPVVQGATLIVQAGSRGQAFLRRALGYAQRMTEAPLLVRLDSGHDSLDNLKVCRKHGAHYIIKRNLRKEGQAETYWTSLTDDPATMIALYRAHGTSEQFHSELKTDLDLERLPSGKLQTNALVLDLGMLVYNILRLIGQQSLREGGAPIRKVVFRRRLRSVIQDLMYLACRLVRHARRWSLSFGRHCSWFANWRGVYLHVAPT